MCLLVAEKNIFKSVNFKASTDRLLDLYHPGKSQFLQENLHLLNAERIKTLPPLSTN